MKFRLGPAFEDLGQRFIAHNGSELSRRLDRRNVRVGPVGWGKAAGGGAQRTTGVVVGGGPGESKFTKSQGLGVPILDETGFVHLITTGELPL